MLPLLSTLVLAQMKVAVIDVSAPDAVYEDESRALAEDVTAALNSGGFVAEKVDERDLPLQGCRIGPCLGKVSLQRGAQVVVALDGNELPDKSIGVTVTAMRATDGLPLAATRYTAKPGAKPPHQVAKFAKELFKEASKALAVLDGGRPAQPVDAGR